MRSFSNLWFWIALAVLWSTASHWVIGVPYDLVTRARRGQENALADVQVLVQVYATRINYISQASGMVIVGVGAFVLASLGVAGFVYNVEFCQALLLLGLPMSVVAIISSFTAAGIPGLEGEALLNRLRWHRVKVQMVGVVSIFTTSMWGMWTNMNASVLGG